MVIRYLFVENSLLFRAVSCLLGTCVLTGHPQLLTPLMKSADILVLLVLAVACDAWSQPLELRSSTLAARRSRTWLHASAVTSSAPVRDAGAVEDNETEKSPLLSQLEDLEGIWYSDDVSSKRSRNSPTIRLRLGCSLTV